MSASNSVKNSKVDLSASNLGGSKGNLAPGNRSRYGSVANVTNAKEQDANPAPPKNVQYENTYQLKSTKKFQSQPVRKIIQEILEQRLGKAKYDGAQVAEMTRTLTDEILAAVKKLAFDRYKLIVDVTIGEYKGQGIKIGSRCLWDTATDNFASVNYKNVGFA